MVLAVAAGSGGQASAAAGNEDPWPEWQRTAGRLGRADSIGPQTPTIAWSVRVDPSDIQIGRQQVSTPCYDAKGRIFAGHFTGITAVDASTHEIIWHFVSDSVDQSASLWKGRLCFGTPEDIFYCIDTETGEEVWQRPAAPHPNRGSAIDANGIVYYPSGLNVLYARRVEDGSEVWTHNHPDIFNSAPALDGQGHLFIGNLDLGQWLAFDARDGAILWDFPVPGSASGTSLVENGRVYVAAGSARLLFCIDAQTGDEIWRFNAEYFNETPPAARADGVLLHLASNGSTGRLYAISPDGDELWRYEFFNQGVNHPPIVDAEGNTYFCSYFGNTEGWVHAVGADGDGLWVKEMPNMCAASPMLAPDGTLFIMCSDHFLYAFKDPDLLGDLNENGTVGIGDLLILLAAWGPCRDLPEPCPADLDLDGTVGIRDLLILLANWG
ncbi:MAG: outer membrane protein assembly factor BamB family protein [Planctomycetota bacterium]|jgi:outer membrane protein assembly factor BamB